MEDPIIRFISQYITLTGEEKELLKGQNVIRAFPRDTILLAEGDSPRTCYFVIKGCVRAYYLKDGEERNTDFYFEQQTIVPINYNTDRPSPHFLACLEDCMLAEGDPERNRKLLEQIPALSKMVGQLNEQLLTQKTIAFDQFKQHSPEERYQLLLENQPELLKRIPLYHLASYLGITHISLSRIRKRLAQKNNGRHQ